MITTFIANSERIPLEQVKQAVSFLGFIVYQFMILQTSLGMTYYHYPLKPGQVDTLQMKSSYLWLVIE